MFRFAVLVPRAFDRAAMTAASAVLSTDVSGVLDFGDTGGSGGPAALASALPGETVQVTVALGKPVALDTGQTFAIREGGRTVGAGTVTALLD